MVVDGFKQATDDNSRYAKIWHAYTIATGILPGFLSSEYYASFEKAWSIFDSIDMLEGIPNNRVNEMYKEAVKDNGEVNFWMGIASASDFKWDASSSWLDRALEDKLLLRKMQLASLLLRAWCKVHLRKYNEALTDLVTITEDIKLRTPEGKRRVKNIKGFVDVLVTCDISIEESAKLVAILPSGEAEEIALESGRQIQVPSTELNERMETFENITNRLQQIIEPVKQKIEDILNASPDATRKRLLEDGKGWVDKIADPGL